MPEDVVQKAKAKILVVDDEEDVFSIVTTILDGRGYEFHYAENGTVGFIKAKQTRPDLIILDIGMPIMDGFEVQRILKEYEPTKKIPILFLTASTILEYRPLAMSQGAVGYLKKPINEEQLISNVDLLLTAAKENV